MNEECLFYNIGYVIGKLEVISDSNIKRADDELKKIYDELIVKMNLISKIAMKESQNKKIEAHKLTRTMYF